MKPLFAMVQKTKVRLREAIKGRVLIVEDEELLRDSLGQLLGSKGYEVAFAGDGKDALEQLHVQAHGHLQNAPLPDIILLDLRMPRMDGWQFRAIQKDDPKLGLIPVIAFSADGTAKAAAISAQAYLRKPVEPAELLGTIERVLLENRRQLSERLDESERLASLGRLAAGVGHEINNPLTFVMLNLCNSVALLRTALQPAESESCSPAEELARLKGGLSEVLEMLDDCQIGSDRIRTTVLNLQRLSRQNEQRQVVDLNEVIERSLSMVWNQVRHHARVTKKFAVLPPIFGNGAQLEQVFSNVLVNAAQAIAEGDAEGNAICIATSVDTVARELLVEISDSGQGIAPEILSEIFEPFFTTKPLGQGTGLGLSISRQTIVDHGGRIAIESTPPRGSIVRIHLPTADVVASTPQMPVVVESKDRGCGRVLVIDDELLIGRVVRAALDKDHDVVVVERGSEAIALLARGDVFDVILCDLVMPDVNGPEFHAAVAQRWPQFLPRIVFMTGGAFTLGTANFVRNVRPKVLRKPFKGDALEGLVQSLLKEND